MIKIKAENKLKVLILLILAISIIFYSQPLENFRYKLEFHSYVLIINLSALLWIIKSKVLQITKSEIHLLLFSFLILLFILLKYNKGSDLNIIENIGFVSLLFLPIKFIINGIKDKELIRVIIFLFLGTIFLILILAFFKSSSLLNITGGLFNSTYFCNYITLFIPLLFIIYKESNHKKIRQISLIIQILILLVCIVNTSRGSLFSVFIFYIISIDRDWFKENKKKYLLYFNINSVIYYLLLSKNKLRGWKVKYLGI